MPDGGDTTQFGAHITSLRAEELAQQIHALITTLRRSGYDISVDGLMAATGIFYDEVARSPDDLSRLSRRLTPIFANSAAAQKDIAGRIDNFVAGMPQFTAAEKTVKKRAERKSWKSAILAGFALLALGVAAVAYYWAPVAPEPVSIIEKAPTPLTDQTSTQEYPIVEVDPRVVPLPQQTAIVRETIASSARPWLLVASIFIPIWLVVIWWLLRWRRRSRWTGIASLKVDAPEDLSRAFLEAGIPISNAVGRAGPKLGTARYEVSGTLDVRETINATVRSAGFLTPIDEERGGESDYVVLVERLSPNDHLTRIADATLDRIAAAGVNIRRFYYRDDPRFCHSDRLDRETRSFEELAQDFGRHRFLVMGAADGFFHPVTGEFMDWPAAENAFLSKALLSSRPADRWTYRESELARRGFLVGAASPEGVASYGDSVVSGADLLGGAVLPPPTQREPVEVAAARTTPEQAAIEFGRLLRELGVRRRGLAPKWEAVLNWFARLYRPIVIAALIIFGLEQALSWYLGSPLAISRALAGNMTIAAAIAALLVFTVTPVGQIAADVLRRIYDRQKASTRLRKAEDAALALAAASVTPALLIDFAAEGQRLRVSKADHEMPREQFDKAQQVFGAISHQAYLMAALVALEFRGASALRSFVGEMTGATVAKNDNRATALSKVTRRAMLKTSLLTTEFKLADIWRSVERLTGPAVVSVVIVAISVLVGLATARFISTPNSAVETILVEYRTGDPLPLDCPTCPTMIYIGPGVFTMGSPDTEEGRYGDEGPQRQVSISAFALAETEVTFDQWAACVADGGCQANPSPDDEGWGKGDRPVINISWEDAQEYIEWLNTKVVQGAPYRLPSEAEWEFAARAGTTTAYAWGDTASHEFANYGAEECCSGLAEGSDKWADETAPVGSFPENDLGLKDMHGNVYEWVEDCWSESYLGAPSNGTPFVSQLGADCPRRVVRGGSWNGNPQDLRSAARLRGGPVNRSDVLGFRPARTPLTP